jgi:Family of unknown function (DUF5317)
MPLLIFVLIIPVVIALLRGGNLGNLTDMSIRGWWLLFVGFGMQVASNSLNADQGALIRGLVLGSYVVLLSVVAANWSKPGMWMTGLGLFMNFLVIAANGGMPVLPEAVELAGGTLTFPLDAKHVVVDTATRLPFLADLLPLPGNVISIGDVFFAIGLGVLIEDQVRKPAILFRKGARTPPGSAAT